MKFFDVDSPILHLFSFLEKKKLKRIVEIKYKNIKLTNSSMKFFYPNKVIFEL